MGVFLIEDAFAAKDKLKEYYIDTRKEAKNSAQ